MVQFLDWEKTRGSEAKKRNQIIALFINIYKSSSG